LLAAVPRGGLEYPRRRIRGLNRSVFLPLLSQTGEYALRAVVHIARRVNQGPVAAKEIAAETNVPLKYLQKILRDLVRAEVLTSARGIGGGFVLSRPAAELCLLDAIRPFDDVLRRLSCPFGNPECGVANPCPVHHQWSGIVAAYKSFLEGTTLADLLPAPARRVTRRRKN